MYRGMAKKFSHNHGTPRKITTITIKKIKIVTTNAHTYRDGKRILVRLSFGGGVGGGKGGGGGGRSNLKLRNAWFPYTSEIRFLNDPSYIFVKLYLH